MPLIANGLFTRQFHIDLKGLFFWWSSGVDGFSLTCPFQKMKKKKREKTKKEPWKV